MVAMHAAADAPGHGAPARRLLVALGVSLLVHYLVAGGWSGSGGTQRATIAPPPLQARLEPLDGPPPLSTAHVAMAASAPPAQNRVAPQAGAESSSGPDARFYLARELDQYPAPLAPLFPGGRAPAAGRVRLWVSIDHTGRVVDAALVDAEPPAAVGRHMRDLVLAMRFAPARKDGRPVKSRVLLALGG